MINESKVYYKVLTKEMESPCQGMEYELNKIYVTEGEIEVCGNGFHACEELWQVIVWADGFKLNECRFFECHLGNEIKNDKCKVCSNSIQLIKEISFDETMKHINENLENLVDDENWIVRKFVARQGYGLDKLINDKERYVRLEVVRQGYGLGKLINDEYWMIRLEVAKKGYGLDRLVNDEDWKVRLEVANKMYELYKLINDKDCYVKQIAKQKLEEIKNDKQK